MKEKNQIKRSEAAQKQQKLRTVNKSHWEVEMI